MDCIPPDSSVHGILQARILEWVVFTSPGSFPTQGSNPGLLRCRQILYRLSHSSGKPDLSDRGSTKYRLLRKASRTGGASKTKSQRSRERRHAGSCDLRSGAAPLRAGRCCPHHHGSQDRWGCRPPCRQNKVQGTSLSSSPPLCCGWVLKAEVCTLGRGWALYGR